MKKQILGLCLIAMTALLSSCGTVVQPNYGGVLMENYGKNGKSDFTEVAGRVSTWGFGTELYQVPLWEQRALVDDSLHMEDADKIQFSAYPKYSYKVKKGHLIDIVFNNNQLGKDNFLQSLESQILEPRIYDITKEQSRRHKTDSLMLSGAGLKFEKECEGLIRKSFEELGFELITFSFQGKFSQRIMDKIDQKLETNTNMTLLDQKIMEQIKTNRLESLITVQQNIKERGLTPAILEQMRIEKWDGHYPTYYSGSQLPMVTTPLKGK